jgi:GT2 family glycosyltransferase
MTPRARGIAVLNFVRRLPVIRGVARRLALHLAETHWGRQLIFWMVKPHLADWGTYPEWIEAYDRLTPEDRSQILAHIERLERRPKISVVMPAYQTPPALIRRAIESVRAQLYPDWELCIADDASPDPALWELLQDYAAQDPRIKVVRRGENGHISRATHSALALATGEYVALMDHDDRLAERALYEVAAAINRHPGAALIYSDEDKIDAQGRRSEAYFKPDFNYELLLQQNLVSHLGVYRRDVLEAVGGLRSAFDGSQDYDLALRVYERVGAEAIHHIPAVLYHWRQNDDDLSFSESQLARCTDAARRAVEEHLARTGQQARVGTPPDRPGWVEVRRSPPVQRPMVSVIIPTRDRAGLLQRAAAGVLHETDYAPLELIIVDNGSVESAATALLARLAQDPRVRVLPAPGPFNYSRLNNLAAAAAKGEVLLLLNNDVSMIHADWLDEMVAHAVRPNVGAVGAKLLFPNDRVQHAGVVLGAGGPGPVAAHFGAGALRHDPGYWGHLGLVRNVSAVTAACLAVRRSVYEAVGGFDETVAVAFNDVDFCLKLRARGYDIVWTPFAELHHHESASRGQDAAGPARVRFDKEVAVLRARWGARLESDPFYNPNLDQTHADCRLAFPPAVQPTWRG